ncbi:MAG: DUF418 domain-containing protein [Phycisphaeraceae bacterium]|nr:DUF418 domain-containing protein [Phycisphaeraceae bacterium]
MPAPIARAERIASIDVLRGVALLGILVMNIPFFALSPYGWPDPFVSGGREGADFWTWVVQEMLFNMKMMAIFSMLFGAGIVIFAERAGARGVNPTGLHYRRTFWLLLIGLVHAYLIWFGDILVTYAMCGAVVFWCRRWPAGALLIVATVMMAVPVPIGAGFGAELERSHAAMVGAMDAERAGALLSDGQIAALERWVAAGYDEFYPDEAMLEAERRLREAGGVALLRENARYSSEQQTTVFLTWGFWRVGGMMLLGMALHRLRVLDASRSLRVYGSMIALGYGVGLTLVWIGARALVAHGFDPAAFFRADGNWNYCGSLLVALGHVGLVMAVCRLGALRRVTGALAAVGRMALTNYLMQSIVCMCLFSWWGLGLWGTMSRGELMLIVGAIWAGQLALSPVWLASFRFGPAEWLWRSLTYGKRQPMRIVGD